jgi:hypothetical protein
MSRFLAKSLRRVISRISATGRNSAAKVLTCRIRSHSFFHVVSDCPQEHKNKVEAYPNNGRIEDELQISEIR